MRSNLATLGLLMMLTLIVTSTAAAPPSASPVKTAPTTAATPAVPTLTVSPTPTLRPPSLITPDPKLAGSSTAATTTTFTTRLSGVAFEWDFGGGAIPNTVTSTTSTSPSVVLSRPGTYNVRVVARPATGVAQEGRASFVVSSFRKAETLSSTTTGMYPSSLVVLPSGDAVVVKCVRTSTLWPLAELAVRRAGASALTIFPITTTEDTCSQTAAAVGPDGRLRALISKSNNRVITLYTARTTAIPTTPADWQTVVVATDAQYRSFLAFRSDGRPVVAYGNVTSPMIVAIATSAVPTEPAHWVKADGPRFNADFGFTLVRDRPSFLFRTDLSNASTSPDNGVRLAIASTPDPRGPTDFPLMTLPRPPIASQYGGWSPTLGIYDGRLVAFHRERGAMRFARATVDVPTRGEDFAISNLVDRVVDAKGDDVVPAAVSTFQGRLMLTYDTGMEHRVSIALTRTPAGPADWDSFVATSAGAFSAVARPSEILVAHLDFTNAKLALSSFR